MPILVDFLLLALTWGSSFLLMKIGLEGLAPGQVVLARMGFGALTLLLLSAVTRTRVARGRFWLHALVLGVMQCTFPFLLFAWAEQHISSSMASILNATTPLMTALVSLVALRQERGGSGRLVGLLLGFLGVVVLVAPWSGGTGGALAGELACLGATACYGTAFTWMRRFVTPLGLPALTVATAQVLMGALAILALSPVVAATPVHLSVRIVLAMLALGGLGSGLAYYWNARIVAAWGATNASTVTYLLPVVGVVLGVVVLGEHVTWSEPLGALLVIAGIAATQGRLRLPGRR